MRVVWAPRRRIPYNTQGDNSPHERNFRVDFLAKPSGEGGTHNENEGGGVRKTSVRAFQYVAPSHGVCMLSPSLSGGRNQRRNWSDGDALSCHMCDEARVNTLAQKSLII